MSVARLGIPAALLLLALFRARLYEFRNFRLTHFERSAHDFRNRKFIVYFIGISGERQSANRR